MLTAKDAAARLGVSLPTLYAYVSRGWIRSYPHPREPRQRLYSIEDVDRRTPARAAERALHWGGPVLESSITLITEERLYYRGHDVTALARTRSIEEVASLIWTGNMTGAAFAAAPALIANARGTEGLPFVNRAGTMLPLVAARDPS